VTPRDRERPGEVLLSVAAAPLSNTSECGLGWLPPS